MVYAIQHPFTGELLYPSAGSHWRYGQNDMLNAMSGWCEYKLQELDDAEKRAQICGVEKSDIRAGVKAIILAQPLEESSKKAREVYEQGPWPKFFFSKNGMGGIARKTYRKDVGGVPPTNFFPFSKTGHTDEAKKELHTIFGGSSPFDTPKPTRLLEFILKIAADPNALILDSFAGSGTTAHAVLNMNKADGGIRRFILVEMEDYADSITAERVKRVISGYGEGKKSVEGTGGDFSFFELGQPLMIGDVLNEDVGVEKIREYVYFTETKARLPEPYADEPYFMGVHVNSAYYFYYEQDAVTTLNREFLHTVKTKADAYVIYADLCMLSEAELEAYHITFKKIPRDITKL